MGNLIEIVTAAEFSEIETVWEASVRASHSFLKEEDIRAYKAMFPDCLVPLSVYCIKQEDAIAGFIGVSGRKIEVLFVRPDLRSNGIGKRLMEFAIDHLAVDQVDVNEQNQAALAFYLHLGFMVAGRSERDGLNKPYPLLHLQR